MLQATFTDWSQKLLQHCCVKQSPEHVKSAAHFFLSIFDQSKPQGSKFLDPTREQKPERRHELRQSHGGMFSRYLSSGVAEDQSAVRRHNRSECCSAVTRRRSCFTLGATTAAPVTTATKPLHNLLFMLSMNLMIN